MAYHRTTGVRAGDQGKAASWSESKRVRVFRSDPLDYHSIADAVRGCSGVFYSFDTDSYDVSGSVLLLFLRILTFMNGGDPSTPRILVMICALCRSFNSLKNLHSTNLKINSIIITFILI